ncbi:PEP-CTERM protein-sorting domain-containing protein [[Clostridium] aminophilum]|uniref:PEP-CTERM protein-sorting domain-containing protein n=1 Tax=[Clostridium] aminophilum TaxID=1526 RepID=A0A1I0HRF8_9FIRM|nr:hypothetical protein [[Clostridium] aminophilum]SET85756.1 PEP-CTERM protein-sorting domain-containing protein [[Clostridium] aminophilum]
MKFYGVILDFLIPVPVTLFMLLTVGSHGAWMAKPLINLLVVMAAWVCIRRQPGKTIREKMLLPEHFGAAPEQELCFSVDSMEDVNGISRIAIAFALENGFAIRMMMKLSRDIHYTGLYGMNNLIIHV